MKTFIAAGALALTAAAADAATIDFTDRSVWSSAASTTTVLGSTVSLSSSGGVINFAQNFDGARTGVCLGFGGTLACGSDGLGVGDDEISQTQTLTESVTVAFSNALRVVSVSFLDLFLAGDGSDLESAEIYFNNDISTLISLPALQATGNNRPGFASYSLSDMIVTSITFRSALSNDNLGRADYALASIEVAPVPLPAAAWMLLAGLGGLVALRRRAA